MLTFIVQNKKKLNT